MSSKHLSNTCTVITEANEEFIRLRAAIDRLMLPIAQQYGLTPTQVTVLNLIRKVEHPTVSKLFRTLNFNQGNMSSLCKRLEEEGFITRTKCAEDERKSYLCLTEKALEVLSHIDGLFTFTEDESWLSKEEFIAAQNALITLKETAKKINDLLSNEIN